MSTDTDTLPPAVELAAARMDMQCATSVLAHLMIRIKVMTRVPASAPFAFAYYRLLEQAAAGSFAARYRLREFEDAGTAWEGARTALALAERAVGGAA